MSPCEERANTRTLCCQLEAITFSSGEPRCDRRNTVLSSLLSPSFFSPSRVLFLLPRSTLPPAPPSQSAALETLASESLQEDMRSRSAGSGCARGALHLVEYRQMVPQHGFAPEQQPERTLPVDRQGVLRVYANKPVAVVLKNVQKYSLFISSRSLINKGI